MKHLKKSFILSLIFLTSIIGSWTFAPNLFISDANVMQEVMKDSVLVGAGSNFTTPNPVGSESTNTILQSTDGGQTWQDISYSLPGNEEPGSFYAGESELYLQVKDDMYHSTGNLKTPVWEKVNAPDQKNKAAVGWPVIAFNRSGVMAYNYQGEIFQKTPAADPDSHRDWLPIHTNSKKYGLMTIFETSDGTVFLGCDRSRGLYKSADRGQSWKHVLTEGWVMQLAELEGVLIATGSKGIMRSTDNGEHWEWVISEGGTGFEVERIHGGFAALTHSNITKSRRIHISLDNGKTWKAIDEGLQPSMSISSIKQVGKYLLCGHPDGIFRSSDMGKTWKMVHPGFDEVLELTNINGKETTRDKRKVFKLSVSGNVVYAVARKFGC